MPVDARKTIALLFFVLAIRGSAAVDDPFSGVWKLNPQKSVLHGEQLTIEDLGNGEFKFIFGQQSYAIAADAKEHQVRIPPTATRLGLEFTESIVRTSSNTWKVAIKQNGRTGEGTLSVAKDGKTLTAQGTVFVPQVNPTNGSGETVLSRVGNGSGFPGIWEIPSREQHPVDLPVEIDIAPYKEAGLSIVFPAQKAIQAVEFESGNYPQQSVNLLSGPVIFDLSPPKGPGARSARRIDPHTMQFDVTSKGIALYRDEYRISADGGTLRLTRRFGYGPGPSEAVYERQRFMASPVTVASGVVSIAIDRSGNLLLASRDQVSKLDSHTHKQSTVARFHFARGMTADNSGNVFIADTNNSLVLKVSANGSLSAIGHGIAKPFGIAVDASGNVFVSEFGQRNVVKISPDGSQSAIHQDGDSERTLMGIAVSQAGNLLIADTGYDRVIQIPSSGSGRTILPAVGLSGPVAVAADPHGDVFIADAGNGRVVEITPDGQQSTVLIGLSNPSGIAVDQAEHLFVADNGRVLEVSVPDAQRTRSQNGHSVQHAGPS